MNMAKIKIGKKQVDFRHEAGKPSFIMIQTYDQMTKKELQKYVFDQAHKYVESVSNCYYQIMKFEDGYIVEIQEGGEKLGILRSLMKHLEENETAVVELANRKVLITRKKVGAKTTIKSHFLIESDKKEPTESIAFVDKLNPIITKGYGLWRFSIAYAVLGILTMVSGAAFKFIVNDKDYMTQFVSSGKTVPIKQIRDVIIAKPRDGNFINAIKFENGNWSREEKMFPKETLPSQTVKEEQESKIISEVDISKSLIDINKVDVK
ncbi:hypothetical protein ACI2KR_07505 [Pseudomonas luteola]